MNSEIAWNYTFLWIYLLQKLQIEFLIRFGWETEWDKWLCLQITTIIPLKSHLLKVKRKFKTFVHLSESEENIDFVTKKN